MSPEVYKDGSGLSEEEEDGSELWQGHLFSLFNQSSERFFQDEGAGVSNYVTMGTSSQK